MMGRKFCGYTWADMNRVLDLICDVENRTELTKQQENDFDIAIQCVAVVMNRMKVDGPINWDKEDENDQDH